jgi:nucleoside 2-deoxyribosyltransferase
MYSWMKMNDVMSRANRQKPIRVFLSHADADIVGARRIRNLLFHQLGLQVFLHEDLSAGENWRSKLRKELERADIFVVLLSPWSVTDSWLLQETGAAWALKKPTVPIVTRRDVLNNFPIALDPQMTIEINYLEKLEEPENADKFVRAFENALTASHRSIPRTA